MQGVLIVERMVLECLEKRSRNLAEIQEDTGLSYQLLINVLSLLLARGMVNYQKSEYSLNLAKKSDWFDQVKDENSIKAELKELFSSLVNQYYQREWSRETSLNIQKIWLTKEEKKALDLKLKEINSFINKIKSIRKARPEKERTKEKQVLIWGTSSYHSLVDSILNAV